MAFSISASRTNSMRSRWALAPADGRTAAGTSTAAIARNDVNRRTLKSDTPGRVPAAGIEKATDAAPARQRASLAVAASLALAAMAGCGGRAGDTPTGFMAGFLGAVVADEPYAAEVGREIVSAGGSAADAAVAMYFAMAVTLPSAASLGANGVCIAHAHKTRQAEAIVFAAPRPATASRAFDIAVPTAVRGMTLLHARHGALRWEQLVAPAERMAREGVPVSRALARDLREGAARLRADPAARRVFERGGGAAVGEGDRLTQIDLAATLSTIRVRGGGEFFAGAFARRLSDAVRDAGGGLSETDMRAAVASATPAATTRFGSHTVYFAPSPPFQGGVAARAAFTGAAPVSAGGAGGGEAAFVAIDRQANAVACVVGMNGPFGSARMAPGTGILMAAPPDSGGGASAAMVVANTNTGDALLAGAASGGGGPAAVGTAARLALGDGRPLGAAIAATSGGQVGMIVCPAGLRQSPGLCQVVADPRGYGLALVAGR
ncbi:MAG: gamma-glutamyltransferase [Rhodospirillales bacterium]|nr:MAG: gamma-glutamyltransferase [Rhodospirillales bacterium]